MQHGIGTGELDQPPAVGEVADHLPVVAVGAVTVDARLVPQQLADRVGGGRAAIELRNPRVQRIIQAQASGLDELHDRGRREGLGVRGHVEQVRGGQWLTRDDIGRAQGEARAQLVPDPDRHLDSGGVREAALVLHPGLDEGRCLPDDVDEIHAHEPIAWDARDILAACTPCSISSSHWLLWSRSRP